MRVILLDFLEADIFNVSIENCVTFLDPGCRELRQHLLWVRLR
jgi:hypothetical protein